MSTKKRSVWNKTQQFQFISIQTGFGEIRNYQTQNSKCPSMYFHRPSALHQHKQSVFHSADTRQSPNKRNQNDRKCYGGPKQLLQNHLFPSAFFKNGTQVVQVIQSKLSTTNQLRRVKNIRSFHLYKYCQ